MYATMTGMNPLKILGGLVKALTGRSDPRHVAAGFALGAMWGLVPKGNLMSVVFLLLFFFFQVDKGVAALSALLFTSAGYLLDGPAHSAGLALLTFGALKPLWTFLYDTPIIPLTKFNNTVVLGNLAFGALLYAPLYVAAKRGAARYQSTYAPLVAKWPLVKAANSLKIVQLYRSLTAD